MIRSVSTHVSQPALAKPMTTTGKTTKTTGKSTTATVDFRKLLQPAATTTTTKTADTSGDVPHLGPFTGDLNTHPAVPAPKAPDPITSSPWLPAGFVGDTDLMNKAQHESTMNSWLQNYTSWSNDNKTQIYQQAMANWQQNDQRCQELGIARPPQPTAPTLDPIQPMPAGYWFKS
jgi:hypothetical protein